MAIERVRDYFGKCGKDKEIIELQTSTATVELAALALGVEPGRIAKTLSLRNLQSAMLLVVAGDARLDNSKFKARFGFKAKMLNADEVLEYTGHAIGGVCPFGLENDLPVFLDISLKRFQTVFPACGSSNSAIELTCDQLDCYAKNEQWVDVCKEWQTGN